MNDNTDLNQYDENGETSLLIAVKEGDIPSVKRLLEDGADPDKEDETWGVKPIDIARKKALTNKSHGEIAKLLEEASENYRRNNILESTYTYNSGNYKSTTPLYIWLFRLGFISLLLAPFTGITVVTAAAFFIIGWILEQKNI